ncbi:hypothetical protein DFO67_1259 [Modicisalibacter xianhensis]|uniref:Uncharacterized protein n=1 Tax=Modicisalibacter xianhensis TaxID=442341 RepID=A0A4R8FM76_9GAMM|nr:hypothetical protein DFO67_1259 [Halomonas xianhensis]
MAQILHKRATTTHAVRAEIQRSTESAATLSRRYGINPKTVRKWRSRDTVEDTRMGPERLVPRRCLRWKKRLPSLSGRCKRPDDSLSRRSYSLLAAVNTLLSSSRSSEMDIKLHKTATTPCIRKEI